MPKRLDSGHAQFCDRQDGKSRKNPHQPMEVRQSRREFQAIATRINRVFDLLASVVCSSVTHVEARHVYLLTDLDLPPLGH